MKNKKQKNYVMTGKRLSLSTQTQLNKSGQSSHIYQEISKPLEVITQNVKPLSPEFKVGGGSEKCLGGLICFLHSPTLS